jgi:hypothetical protein
LSSMPNAALAARRRVSQPSSIGDVALARHRWARRAVAAPLGISQPINRFE